MHDYVRTRKLYSNALFKSTTRTLLCCWLLKSCRGDDDDDDDDTMPFVSDCITTVRTVRYIGECTKVHETEKRMAFAFAMQQ